MEHVEAILSVGVDIVQFGPADYSGSAPRRCRDASGDVPERALLRNVFRSSGVSISERGEVTI